MDRDKHFPFYEDESGSDELLSDENLRLHALRAWLLRRLDEATIKVGEAALALQETIQEDVIQTRPRRRAHHRQALQQFQYAQKALAESQQRLSAYEQAQSILEDCVAHTNGYIERGVRDMAKPKQRNTSSAAVKPGHEPPLCKAGACRAATGCSVSPGHEQTQA